jgi:hypothetical protein
MTGLHQNVEELLARLAESSRNELDLFRTLADAIRRVDENLLREVRSVTVQHELRREAILGELQNLTVRLCALPARRDQTAPRAAIDQRTENHVAIDAVQNNGGGADWRQAAQNITDDHDEFDFAFQTHRH